MLKIGMVVLGVGDMTRAVAFWTRALRHTVRESGTARWTVLTPSAGTATEQALMVSETPVQAHPRVHVDLSAANAAEQAAEVERLVTLGAARIDWDLYPDDPDFVVLADPDGNCFCVVDISRGHD